MPCDAIKGSATHGTCLTWQDHPVSAQPDTRGAAARGISPACGPFDRDNPEIQAEYIQSRPAHQTGVLSGQWRVFGDVCDVEREDGGSGHGGNEGVTGLALFFGDVSEPSESMIQVPGTGRLLSADMFTPGWPDTAPCIG